MHLSPCYAFDSRHLLESHQVFRYRLKPGTTVRKNFSQGGFIQVLPSELTSMPFLLHPSLVILLGKSKSFRVLMNIIQIKDQAN